MFWLGRFWGVMRELAKGAAMRANPELCNSTALQDATREATVFWRSGTRFDWLEGWRAEARTPSIGHYKTLLTSEEFGELGLGSRSYAAREFFRSDGKSALYGVGLSDVEVSVGFPEGNLFVMRAGN